MTRLNMVEGKAKAKEDKEMKEHVRKVQANDETFKKCLDLARKNFKELYGEEPKDDSSVWLWFISETFDKYLRLAVTTAKQ